MAYYSQENTTSTTDHAFPVSAIVILTSMATALLLITYYIFVNKCFSNFHHHNLLRRLSFLRARHDHEDPYIAFSPSIWINRGLDDSVIREIPSFQFKRAAKENQNENKENSTVYVCVVCLNEFEDNDTVRVLPSCGHAFHIDCIDVWFQSNANCPVCRISISRTTTAAAARGSMDRVVIAPRSSPRDSDDDDDDFVVIELSGVEDGESETRTRTRTRVVKEGKTRSRSAGRSGRKVGGLNSKQRSRGHECMEKDDEFCMDEAMIRRSFSLDSVVDRKLYQSVVQAIIQQRNGSEVCR